MPLPTKLPCRPQNSFSRMREICTNNTPKPQSRETTAWNEIISRNKMGEWKEILGIEKNRGVTILIASFREMRGNLPEQRGTNNLPQAGTPSGRKGEEHKLSPQLAPAATYPRAAAPAGTLRSFARERARAIPGHPGRRRRRAWTFAPSCPWKPQPVHKLRDGAGGGAEPGRQGGRQQSQGSWSRRSRQHQRLLLIRHSLSSFRGHQEGCQPPGSGSGSLSGSRGGRWG